MIDRVRLTEAYARERQDFVARHPRSAAAHRRSGHLFGRVPMTWMNKNAGRFPIYLERAHGNRVWAITASSTSTSRLPTPVRWRGTRPRRP
jgi:glutamate-1-semialdehyde 2,1-aminomutase